MSLTIALATRGRAGLLKKTLERTMPNVKRPDTRLIVMADDDDREMDGFSFPGVEIDRRPRPATVGEKYNRQIALAPESSVYMGMVDYVAHITPGFDQKILDAASLFPDGIGVVYNHMANLSFPFLNAVTKGYVEKVGSFYPEHFPYWFIDHWLDDIARMIGRIAVAQVDIQIDYKPPTQSMREPAFWATLFDAMCDERRKIAFSIIDSPDFQESEWRKKLLKNSHTLILERSQMINSIVRTMDGLDKTTDERYLALREKGIAFMRGRIAELEEQERRAA